MSIEKIREMESGWQRAPELLETQQEKFKPCFVTKPEPVTTQEGSSARFCCRVTGYPKPRVMWLINGHTVINGSRHKLIYDGMWHLDIPKCQDRDGGKIEVIARNQCGEAYATTTLTVKRRKDDYRSVLRHNVKPFCDEEEVTRRQESLAHEAKNEMYSEQRSQMRHAKTESRSYSSTSTEAQEWQSMVKSEARKSAVSYATSSHFDMKNMVGPSLTVGLEPLSVAEGEAATFSVEFVGAPPPEVKWYRYTFPVKDSKDFKIVTTETGSSLTILKTCADDAGVFTCLLENIAGAAKTSSNLVVVETRTTWSSLTTDEQSRRQVESLSPLRTKSPP